MLDTSVKLDEQADFSPKVHQEAKGAEPTELSKQTTAAPKRDLNRGLIHLFPLIPLNTGHIGDAVLPPPLKILVLGETESLAFYACSQGFSDRRWRRTSWLFATRYTG